MFDSANLAHRVDDATFEKDAPKLREQLLNAQYDLSQNGQFPVLIVVGGVEGAGKTDTINLLNDWMDPRHIVTTAFPPPSDEESERPNMWRFWRQLPPKGKIGIFSGAWHTDAILDRVFGRATRAEMDQRVAEILRFERMLSDEGTLILKFWHHLTKDQQKKRLTQLSRDPRTRWRVTETDWKYYKHYDRFVRVSENFTRHTSTGECPWIVVSGAERNYRSLMVVKTLLAAMRERLDEKPVKRLPDRTPPLIPPVDRLNVIRALELDKRTSKKKYKSELDEWQGKLAMLSRHEKLKKTSIVLVFEGNDAAGKGGAIRRVTGALDARVYQSIAIAAPSEDERAQPYLWRFWRRLPRRGRFVIFDRSWYGRVLVERVEGYAPEADWMRAYTEINDFEQQLVDNQMVVVKFWLAIDRDEQLRRFKAREKTPFKRFKITADDWRNRKKWDEYEVAVCDMIDRTSTEPAPWVMVEANNKYYARIKVLRSVCHAIESRLETL
jgi:polyphosphate:AMP phosphotransferase